MLLGTAFIVVVGWCLVGWGIGPARELSRVNHLIKFEQIDILTVAVAVPAKSRAALVFMMKDEYEQRNNNIIYEAKSTFEAMVV